MYTLTSLLICLCGFVIASAVAQTPALTALLNALSALPTPIAYYPLSARHGVRDIGGQNLDAQYSQTPVISVTGPSGTSNTASETGGANGGHTRYITFSSPDFNFGASSWTFSMYVKLNSGIDNAPFLDYTAATTLNVHLWVLNGQLFSNDGWDNLLWLNCDLTSWRFVAYEYDAPSNILKMFCETTSVSTSSSQSNIPGTANLFFIGHRQATTIPPSDVTIDGEFACFSIYPQALNAQQLADVKQLCSQYENALQCTNCIAGTCRQNYSIAVGWQCDSCVTNWVGPSCSIPCSQYCSSGTCQYNATSLGYTCTSCVNVNFNSDQCTTCRDGWVGPSCNIACSQYCSPGTCQYNATSLGYNCTSCVNSNFKSNQCTTCKPGWKKPSCSSHKPNDASDGDESDNKRPPRW